MIQKQAELYLEYLDKMLAVFNYNVINSAASHDIEQIRKAFGNYEFCMVARESFTLLLKDETKFIEEYLDKKEEKAE